MMTHPEVTFPYHRQYGRYLLPCGGAAQQFKRNEWNRGWNVDVRELVGHRSFSSRSGRELVGHRSFSSRSGHLHFISKVQCDIPLLPSNSYFAMTEENQSSIDARKKAGEFVRVKAAFRDWVGGEDGKYPVEANRYHLYVAYNCPWCHRVILTRSLLGLQDAISMDVCFPNRTDETHKQGAGFWQFLPDGTNWPTGVKIQYDSCTSDTINSKSTVVEIYEMVGADLKSSRPSVPVLFDKKTKTIVSNESAEIIEMLAASFLPFAKNPINLIPAEMKDYMEECNEWIYHKVNNGAYKAGFTSSQKAYEISFDDYFDALEKIDGMLAKTTFVCGDQLTLVDMRLFPTIFRHDPIYYMRMKLSHKYIKDYPNLWRWLCVMYAMPSVKVECPLDQMKQGYFGNSWNKVIPRGPVSYLEDLEKGAEQFQ